MRKLRVILLPIVFLLALSSFAQTPTATAPAPQPDTPIDIESLTSETRVEYNFSNDVATATGGVLVRYGETVMTAERATVNQKTSEVLAEGRVRIQQGDQLYAGERILYNFHTKQMQTELFRTGKWPVFAGGEHLRGDITNEVYTAKNSFITTDDISEPAIRLRAKSITIVPGKKISARHAVLYAGGVPVLYLPYYSRALGVRANNFTFIPGYRSRFGPFMLGTYNWFLGESVDGAVHADYRAKRGGGTGVDLNTHMGQWGEMTFDYYYLYDQEPWTDAPDGMTIPHNRQRVNFTYDATPFTNLNLKAAFRYQSDEMVLQDFFESEYRNNPQPNTFVEANKLWDNFSLDVFAQRRINNFFETVERLPDVRLTGYRQQIGPTPLYYESESSLAYLYHRYADTNPPPGLDYSAVRGDSYHQVTLPQTFFGWLNIAPRVGGRFTYYTDTWGAGDTNNSAGRGVFNTGAEATFKVSRVWQWATNSLLQVDGLRHIVEPSINYVYVPEPSTLPDELPQFDSELPSLRLPAIEFPDYNSIDSIDSQNVLRLGLRNRFQTKRDGQIDNLLFMEVFTDWRLQQRDGQDSFSDIYSDVVFRPRSWITAESQTRYSIEDSSWRMLVHNLTLSPNDRWSWSFGHWYQRNDLSTSPTSLQEGSEILRSSFYFKLNENWAFRASQFYDLREDLFQEQSYTVYRDLRSWTVGVTVRIRESDDGHEDFAAALTFSLKAAPRFSVGSDAVRSSQLLGY